MTKEQLKQGVELNSELDRTEVIMNSMSDPGQDIAINGHWITDDLARKLRLLLDEHRVELQNQFKAL